MKTSFFQYLSSIACLQLWIFVKSFNWKSSLSQISLFSEFGQISSLAMIELGLLASQEIDYGSLHTKSIT